MRITYWSNTKFADWIRGNAKPDALGIEEWKSWENYSKTIHPIRFWIAEEGLDYIQGVVYWPMDRFRDVRYFVRNVLDKSHVLYHPTLKLGQWHDIDTRLLYCNFQALVDYVEIECAGMYESSKRTEFFRFRRYRSREDGIAYLIWASNLRYGLDGFGDCEPSAPNFGKLTHQAVAARKALELYMWWTKKFPELEEVVNNTEGFKEYNKLAQELFEQRQQKLKELIDISHWLWS